MTERNDASGEHPAPEVLADLTEGLLSDVEAQGVRSHAAGCPECSAMLDALGEVRALLAAQPDPGPMPAEVAADLDAALATAAADAADSRAALPRALVGTYAEPVPVELAASPPATDLGDLSARRRRRTRWVRHSLQVAAAVVVLGTAGTVAVTGLNGAGLTGGGAESADAGKASSSGPGPGAGAGAGAGGDVAAREKSTLDRTDVRRAAAVPLTASPRDYDRDSLPEAAAKPYRGGDKVTTSSPKGPLRNPASLASCLAALGIEDAKVTVEFATFEGERAAIIYARSPGVARVLAVRPTCSADDPGVLARSVVPR